MQAFAADSGTSGRSVATGCLLFSWDESVVLAANRPRTCLVKPISSVIAMTRVVDEHLYRMRVSKLRAAIRASSS